jgi:hypothetical protein
MMAVASIIEGVPHLKAFETMAEQRFASIDLSVVLMYYVSLAPAAALPYLAEQLDVLGWKGWLFATTEQQKRDLLRKAIELHKKKGTPWAIREALKSVGYLDADIIPQAGVVHDGSIDYDGSETYAGGFWANFLVRVHVPQAYTPTIEDENIVTKIISEYKNERSYLTAIEWINDPA